MDKRKREVIGEAQMDSAIALHVVIFPFMSQGHTMPLLDLSVALSGENVKVTVITTSANLEFITRQVSGRRNVDTITIPFPVTEGLPAGCENTSQMPSFEYFVPLLKATKMLRDPFQQLLGDLLGSANPPVCVISDFFLGWTQDVCDSLRLPRIVFHGMGVLSMAIKKYTWRMDSQIASDLTPIHLPDVELPFSLTKLDLIPGVNDPVESFADYATEAAIADMKSWGILVNSFEELEGAYVPSFESFYPRGAKAWLVGPLLFHREEDDSKLPDWFDHRKHDTNQVIYVAFGTQVEISDAQLDEIAFGLIDSGIPFIWLLRSKTWSIPESAKRDCKGLILDQWVDQRKVLSHPSIGGFLTHAGWNSVMESMAAGVPMLTWPMAFDQPLNAKFVVEGLGTGLAIRKGPLKHDSRIEVWREAISEGVKELMKGEKGREAKTRATVLSRVARTAVKTGGSSYNNLQKMMAELCKLSAPVEYV